MLTKKVFAMLALGGVVKAARTMPFPWRFHLVGAARSMALELSEDDVAALLKRRAIAAPRVDFVTDAYTYATVDPNAIQAKLAEDYTYGFGQCSVCGEVVAATKDLVAARHGFSAYKTTDGTKHSEPCSGTDAKFATLVASPAQVKKANR